MPYTKTVVTIKRVNITRKEAKTLICEARINVPGELDLYTKSVDPPGYIQRVATIPAPANPDPDTLLEYAREHMPQEINC